MVDLQKFKAKVCLTASGTLIYQDKVLLVKHKKLGIWLTPGGHIESDELPHQTAEREFWEETGIKVKAVNYGFMPASDRVEFLPVPLSMNLHWVCQENYDNRLKNSKTAKKAKNWKRGCEQHLDMRFLVKPVADVKYRQNVEETDGIGWFKVAEIDDLETADSIKAELKQAFKVVSQ